MDFHLQLSKRLPQTPPDVLLLCLQLSLAAFRGSIGHSNWVLSCHCVFCSFFQGDLFASTFLIKNGALVNAATLGAQETPLHLVALYSSKKYSADVMSEMAQIAEALLQAGANPNMQDSKGRWVYCPEEGCHGGTVVDILKSDVYWSCKHLSGMQLSVMTKTRSIWGKHLQPGQIRSEFLSNLYHFPVESNQSDHLVSVYKDFL